MGNWTQRIKTLGTAASMLVLGGCYYYGPPYEPPAYTEATVAVVAPTPVFVFSGGVSTYYEPTYSAYVYGDDGYYYRWVNNGWVYTSSWGGYWRPMPPSLLLPPLLVYGPPPPVVGYRPYFVWWRGRVGGWYEENHPVWWQRHERYLANYQVWHANVVRFYENHPGYHPRMRPLFHGRPEATAYRPGRDRGLDRQARFNGNPQRDRRLAGAAAVRQGPAGGRQGPAGGRRGPAAGHGAPGHGQRRPPRPRHCKNGDC